MTGKCRQSYPVCYIFVRTFSTRWRHYNCYLWNKDSNFRKSKFTLWNYHSARNGREKHLLFTCERNEKKMIFVRFRICMKRPLLPKCTTCCRFSKLRILSQRTFLGHSILTLLLLKAICFLNQQQNFILWFK